MLTEVPLLLLIIITLTLLVVLPAWTPQFFSYELQLIILGDSHNFRQQQIDVRRAGSAFQALSTARASFSLSIVLVAQTLGTLV